LQLNAAAGLFTKPSKFNHTPLLYAKQNISQTSSGGYNCHPLADRSGIGTPESRDLSAEDPGLETRRAAQEKISPSRVFTLK
jgi:hypothetical protein